MRLATLFRRPVEEVADPAVPQMSERSSPASKQALSESIRVAIKEALERGDRFLTLSADDCPFFTEVVISVANSEKSVLFVNPYWREVRTEVTKEGFVVHYQDHVLLTLRRKTPQK